MKVCNVIVLMMFEHIITGSHLRCQLKRAADGWTEIFAHHTRVTSSRMLNPRRASDDEGWTRTDCQLFTPFWIAKPSICLLLAFSIAFRAFAWSKQLPIKLFNRRLPCFSFLRHSHHPCFVSALMNLAAIGRPPVPAANCDPDLVQDPFLLKIADLHFELSPSTCFVVFVSSINLTSFENFSPNKK